MRKFLDYTGLKRFKEDLEQSVEKKIKSIVGLDESESELDYAENEDIDKGVFDDEDAGDGVITLHNMAYYHKKHTKKVAEDIKTEGTELNSSVLDAVADALVVKTDGSDEVKTQVYENVEAIVDSKMKWKENYPDTI